jgi:hypothetical protein
VRQRALAQAGALQALVQRQVRALQVLQAQWASAARRPHRPRALER